MKSINEVLEKQLEVIKPSVLELKIISNLAADLISKLNKNLKGKANAFIGGSLAKNTLIKKDRYDIDIFVRFSERFKDQAGKMSNELEKATKKIAKFKRVHGSRDYFHIVLFSKELKKSILFEIVPVLFIKKPKDAENVTDLSFFHVSYVRKKINEKLSDDIRLAKSFCYSQGFYGAESHIQGFSGYALELLVINYKGFINFLKKALNWKLEEKIVIDPEKYYKNANEVLNNLNESKLVSPIIFVDPTFKERNVAASLSQKTLSSFIIACKNFLRKPSLTFFEYKKIDIEKYKLTAKKKRAEFSIISAEINEEIEAVAAAKLFKLFNFLLYKMKKNHFYIIKSEWEFMPLNKAKFYFIFRIPKNDILVKGPPAELIEFTKNFKQQHKNAFVKNKRIYAYIKPLKSIKELLKSSEHEIKSKKGISFLVS